MTMATRSVTIRDFVIFQLKLASTASRTWRSSACPSAPSSWTSSPARGAARGSSIRCSTQRAVRPLARTSTAPSSAWTTRTTTTVSSAPARRAPTRSWARSSSWSAVATTPSRRAGQGGRPRERRAVGSEVRPWRPPTFAGRRCLQIGAVFARHSERGSTVLRRSTARLRSPLVPVSPPFPPSPRYRRTRTEADRLRVQAVEVRRAVRVDGVLDDEVWSRARPVSGLRAGGAQRRPVGHRADRGPHRLRRGQPLHRRVPPRRRRRTAGGHGHQEGLRRDGAGRLLRDPGHLPRPSERLRLHHQPRGRAGGLAGGQRGARDQHELGRGLARPLPAGGRRVDHGDGHPVPGAALRRGRRPALGDQLQPPHPAQERAGLLVSRARAPTPSPGCPWPETCTGCPRPPAGATCA